MQIQTKYPSNTRTRKRSSVDLPFDNSEMILELKEALQHLIQGIECSSKKNVESETNTTAFQLSLLKGFRTESIHEYFIVEQEQSQITHKCFSKLLDISLKKMIKFQKNLLLSIEQFIKIIRRISEWILILSKDLLVQILNTLNNICDQQTNRDLSGQNCSFQTKISVKKSEFTNELKGRISENAASQCLTILKSILNMFNIQLRKLFSALKQYKTYCTFQHQNTEEKYKISCVNKIIAKNLNLVLADFLEEKFKEQCAVMHKCLSCESQISLSKMDAHLELCQSKTNIEQKIVSLDAEITAKMYDLLPELTTARNVLRQKLKELNQKIKQQLALKNGKFKKVKGFYGAPLLSKTLGNQLESDSDDCDSLDSPKKINKTIKDLSIKELSTYITTIEQIQMIGNKIKNQRHAANLAISNDIFNIKNIALHKFNKLHVQCPLVNSLLNLLAQRRDCMRKLSKQMSQAKSSGLKFIEDIVFQNQYEDIADSTRKNKKKKRLLSNYELYFSEQQTPSISNQTQKNKVCLNDFLVLGFLGKGQFGQILLVKKKQTGVKYAMKKVLIKEMKKHSENVENELMALSVVNSEFVVKTIFSFSQNDFHYFVMEYMPNGDFFQLLQYENRLYEAEAKLYLAQIATAINDLHKSGIIHRDIKPQNVLISKSGHIKISDFGLSQSGSLRKSKHEDKKKRMTQFVKEQLANRQNEAQRTITKIVGSPYFMSPEILSGETATVMSDWWSFGILVFEVLTGIPPFIGESFDEIVSKIFQGNIWSESIRFGKDEDEISYEAKDLIEKFLIRNQEQRLGTNFEEIKRHPFFYGVVWDKLTEQKPHFEFEEEQENLGEGKEISSKASSFRSTNPDLKLIRKDILIEETRAMCSQKNKQNTKMKNFIQVLRKSTI